jgi:hypothetical protein
LRGRVGEAGGMEDVSIDCRGLINIIFSIHKLAARQSQAFRTSTTGNETELEI